MLSVFFLLQTQTASFFTHLHIQLKQQNGADAVCIFLVADADGKLFHTSSHTAQTAKWCRCCLYFSCCRRRRQAFSHIFTYSSNSKMVPMLSVFFLLQTQTASFFTHLHIQLKQQNGADAVCIFLVADADGKLFHTSS